MVDGTHKEMVKLIVCICLITQCLVPTVDAFTFLQPYTDTKYGLRLTLQAEKDVTKVGCGTAIVQPGNCQLFDPEKEGKLQGTASLQTRITNGPSYVEPITPDASLVVKDDGVKEAQHWLEDLDNDLPLNFAKASSPVSATLIGRSISKNSPDGIQHLVLRLPKGMHYVEGQSISIIPPGIDSNTGKPHAPRLYSIASTRYGDMLDGNTVSLCVRREEWNRDQTNKGTSCSNYLCDASLGTVFHIAGPVGKTMLLPSDPNQDVIMIATGTGIAPFRGFLHRLFMEDTVARNMFGGTAWLILGVPDTGGLLYKEEIDTMMVNANPGQFRVNYALSREMKNTLDGGKIYVPHIVADHANELFDKLHNGAHIYFCGRKAMMPPILKILDMVARSKGIDWNTKMKELMSNHQWHVEVY